MKPNNKHHFNPGNLPDGFFESQEKSILQKTLEIENWSVPNTKNIDACFSVPVGFWLDMEDSIRVKLKPKPAFQFFPLPKLVYAGVAASLVLIVSFFFLVKPNIESQENWKANVELATNEELLAYVSQSPDTRATTEAWAANALKPSEIPYDIFSADEEIDEETLESYYAEDLIKTLDIN